MIRVLVADDQALIRTGLVALLAAAPGFEPVGEAADGQAAVELAGALRPDVVLLDIRMPRMDGIEALRHILGTDRRSSDPDTGDTDPKVVMLTTFDLDEYVYTALQAGASGFLLKDTPPERILAALRTAVAGDILVSPTITQRLVETYAFVHERASARTNPGLAELSAREQEVLCLVGNGLSNAQIASRLVLSELTVKSHVKHVMSKLGVTSRAQAVVVAYESGLVVPRAYGA